MRNLLLLFAISFYFCSCSEGELEIKHKYCNTITHIKELSRTESGMPISINSREQLTFIRLETSSPLDFQYMSDMRNSKGIKHYKDDSPNSIILAISDIRDASKSIDESLNYLFCEKEG